MTERKLEATASRSEAKPIRLYAVEQQEGRGLHPSWRLLALSAAAVCTKFDEVEGMFAKSKFRLLAVVGVGVAGMVGCGHSGAPVASQSPSAMAPATDAVATVQEIHVNQDCVILQDRVDGVVGISLPGTHPVADGEKDSAVCHLESQLTSNHVKGEVVNGAVQRSVVVVKEQEYLLQNELQTPVVFVVEQPVAEGWKIDSVPAPDKMEGNVALFRAAAAPGQIVRLHVGEAHEIALAE
jgi:hypothetical protein